MPGYIRVKRGEVMNKHDKVESAPHDELEHFKHAHLYYAGMILSVPLFFISLVQAIITHVSQKNLYLAILEYFIATMFLVIARRCYRRGRGHYMY